MVRVKSREDGIIKYSCELLIVFKRVKNVRDLEIEVIHVMRVEIESIERVVIVNRIEENQTIDVSFDWIVVDRCVELVS